MASHRHGSTMNKAILPFVIYLLSMRGFLLEIGEGLQMPETCPPVMCPLATIHGPNGEMQTVQMIPKPTTRADFLPDTVDLTGITRFLCQIPDCFSSPCEHSGTCQETDTGFNCSCTPAYTGERCHLVNEECYVESNGTDYRGYVNTTINGQECQKWTVQSPHGHTFAPTNYPNAGLGDHNYCRNPDGVSAWCYTTNPSVRFEYCNIGVPADACAD